MAMPTVTVHERLDPPERAAVAHLLAEVSVARGQPALGEHVTRLLARHDAGDAVPGLWVATAASSQGTVVAVAVAGPADGSGPGSVVEVAVAPTAANRRGDLEARVLGAAVTAVLGSPGTAGPPVRLWVHDADPTDDAVAASCGFVVERTLLQLRAPLPVPRTPRIRASADLRIRPFRPGTDEDAWVTVNNRAFAGHPEQGSWTSATLREREREPWFDPAGLVLGELDGRLVGSCWTKVHRDVDPPVGEIYVVGVDPDTHGAGIGRALVLAGLEHMERSGLRTAMLYVDAANDPALRLYRSLGFSESRIDRSYVHGPAGSDEGATART
jgi:mycothiol synthase